MLLVLLQHVAIHNNVIEVDDHESIKVGVEDFIHQSEKSGRCIGESKRHNKKFIGPVPCYACCFRLVFFRNADLIISRAQLELSEVPRIPQLIKEIRHQRNGVLVLDSDFVQRSVVDTHA